jgi:hypothetical protein
MEAKDLTAAEGVHGNESICDMNMLIDPDGFAAGGWCRH